MFTHLHVHTEHSSLDGLTRVKDLFDTVQADGGSAVAITDHKSLAAMWEARRHADRTGVKLLPGLEAYIAIGSRTERKTISVSNDDSASEGADSKTSKDGKTRTYEHLTLIAKDRTGWHNLVRLHNESSMHKHGRAQLIDYDVLQKYGAGLMVLTGCIGGPIFGPLSRSVAAERSISAEFGPSFKNLLSRAGEMAQDVSEQLVEATGGNQASSSELLAKWTKAIGERERAKTNIESLIAAVGSDNVFVEVMEHGNADEQAALPELRSLAEQYGLPIVATNDSHHTTKEDQVAHAAWLALQTDSTLANSKFSFHGNGYHIRTEAEMRALNPEPWWQAACDNTSKVAERVSWDALPERKVRLPEFPLPDGFERNTLYFRSLIETGIQHRFPAGLVEAYRNRLNTELNVISSMGFVDYFLIVDEMITWARTQGFYVGPGRGSGAGSLVAYVLGITQLDPIEHDLLFERFLEPGRAELPDFDIDFESRHKQQIIAHLVDLWGEDHVAQIGNIGRPQIRQAFKDALRVLGEPATLADKLAKMLPADVTAQELVGSRGTGVVIREDEQVTVSEFWTAASGALKHIDPILSLVVSFYDVAKVSGIHASGVIISSEPLTGLIPMRWAKPGSADWSRWVTEWDKNDCEDFGLVKFDVLAIRNLDMAHLAIDSIFERTGEQLDFYGLPHPDHDASDPRVQKTFQMLQQGRTAGVFQLESDPMTRLLEEVGPENLGELSAVVALFRPGPLSAGMHTKYADRKHGREPVTYDYLTGDPVEARWLDTVMGTSYGVFIYQEQIMRLGRVVAGFDDVWRSKLRKAVSKKSADLMAEVGGKFLEGATQELIDETGEVYTPVFSVQTANRVWEAMKGSAEYLFNASHSYCYAYVAYITAYLKANYPAYYGAATLSVTPPDKAEKRLAAMRALLDEGMLVLPPDINHSGLLSAPNDAADSVLIGLSEIKGIGSAAETIIRARHDGPFTSLPDLLKRSAAGEEKMTLTHSRVEALIDSGALDAFGSRMGLRFIARLGIHECAALPQMEYTPLELSARQSSRLLMTLDPLVRGAVQQTLKNWERPGTEESVFNGPSALPVSEMMAQGVADGSVVYVSGILTSYEEKPYRKGSFARVTIEDATHSITGILWDQERSAAKADGTFPNVGFPIVAFGKISTRSFTFHGSSDDDDQDGEDQEITRQEITIRGVYPIDVPLNQIGGVDFSPFPRIDLTNPQPPEKPTVKRDTAKSKAVPGPSTPRPEVLTSSPAPQTSGALALAVEAVATAPAPEEAEDPDPAALGDPAPQTEPWAPVLRLVPPLSAFEPLQAQLQVAAPAPSHLPGPSLPVTGPAQNDSDYRDAVNAIAQSLFDSLPGGSLL